MKQVITALQNTATTPLNDAMQYEAEMDAIESLCKEIEQTEFQELVEKMQELEKLACEIIRREWKGLYLDDLRGDKPT